MILATGTWQGRGGHEMRGTFTLTREGDRLCMATSDDFFFDGSPEPAFAVSPDAATDATTARQGRFLDLLGTGPTPAPAIAVRGRQSGLLPEGLAITDIHTIFLWCFGFPFLLGIGRVVPVK